MRPHRRTASALLLTVALAPAPAVAHDLLAGAARVDVSPVGAVRLSGYAAREGEATAVAQPLFARAFAFGSSVEDAALIVVVDAIVIPAALADRIAAAIGAETSLDRARIALLATHSHAAPCLGGAIGNLFVPPPTDAEIEHIDRYTDRFVEGAARAGIEAVRALRPARLAFHRGRVDFAANRRTAGGPVDHELPLLVARDAADGAPIATLAAYACHCTTLGPDFDRACGDWAGFASLAVEEAAEGAVALTAIGCAGDQNPAERGTLELAESQGRALAAEVARLLAAPGRAVEAPPACSLTVLALPFAPAVAGRSRADWEARAAEPGHAGVHGRHFLAMLERGEAVPAALDLPIQTVRCGDDLALVLLGGEVVVDYALRLRAELDPERLFVAAYVNDCPGYIPSERVLAEGGYEGGLAMTYYLQPGPLAPGLEQRIVDVVRRELGPAYARDGGD